MDKADILAKLSSIADEPPTNKCTVCPNGQGYILLANGKVNFCECSMKRRLHRLWQDAGVKPEFWNMTLANWDLKQDANGNDLGPETKAKRFAHTFMKKYIACLPALCAGHGLEITTKRGGRDDIRQYLSAIFYGGHKSGKTLLLSIAVMKAIEMGRSAKMYSWKDDLRPACVEFEGQYERVNNIANEFKHYDVIAIDGLRLYDIKPNEYLALQIDRLSDVRVDSGKPTLIGCEAEDYRAVEAYDAWSGLFDTCYPIRLPGLS